MSPIEEKLHDALDHLKTRDDFVRFVELLIVSYTEESSPWVNASIESFLAALAQAAKQLEAYYDTPVEAAQNVASPNWEAIGGMLFTARCKDVE